MRARRVSPPGETRSRPMVRVRRARPKPVLVGGQESGQVLATSGELEPGAGISLRGRAGSREHSGDPHLRDADVAGDLLPCPATEDAGHGGTWVTIPPPACVPRVTEPSVAWHRARLSVCLSGTFWGTCDSCQANGATNARAQEALPCPSSVHTFKLGFRRRGRPGAGPGTGTACADEQGNLSTWWSCQAVDLQSQLRRSCGIQRWSSDRRLAKLWESPSLGPLRSSRLGLS
jgi:hypothetical protein